MLESEAFLLRGKQCLLKSLKLPSFPNALDEPGEGHPQSKKLDAGKGH